MKNDNRPLWVLAAILAVGFFVPPLEHWIPEAMAEPERTTERQSGDSITPAAQSVNSTTFADKTLASTSSSRPKRSKR